jgi:hypothetical protein
MDDQVPREQIHSDKEKDRDADRLGRLEKSLEQGLEDTFPASDAISVIQPAPRAKAGPGYGW